MDMVLSLINNDGKRLATVEDLTGNGKPSLSVLLWKAGTYVVQASCLGDGGSGPYVIKRTAIDGRQLKVGMSVAETSKTDPTVWTVEAKAGQNILVVLNRETRGVNADVYTPEGDDLTLLDDGWTATTTIRCQKSGTYTISVRSSKPGAKYTLRTIDLDK
jgi:hypothetical protein